MEYVWIVLKICLMILGGLSIVVWVSCYFDDTDETKPTATYTSLMNLLNTPYDSGCVQEYDMILKYFDNNITLRFEFYTHYGTFIESCNNIYINNELINNAEFHWWEKDRIIRKLKEIRDVCKAYNIARANANILKEVNLKTSAVKHEGGQ